MTWADLRSYDFQKSMAKQKVEELLEKSPHSQTVTTNIDFHHY